MAVIRDTKTRLSGKVPSLPVMTNFSKNGVCGSNRYVGFPESQKGYFEAFEG